MKPVSEVITSPGVTKLLISSLVSDLNLSRVLENRISTAISTRIRAFGPQKIRKGGGGGGKWEMKKIRTREDSAKLTKNAILDHVMCVDFPQGL